jgi:hypothetical protein
VTEVFVVFPLTVVVVDAMYKLSPAESVAMKNRRPLALIKLRGFDELIPETMSSANAALEPVILNNSFPVVGVVALK